MKLNHFGETVRIAVLGLGSRGISQMNTLLEMKDVDVTCVCDSYQDRADLYARIDRRVEEMAEEGLFEEVEKLLKEGLSADCTAMQAIGYKEAVLALRGEIGREEALALIRQNSRRYAKRQLTWFGREESAHWIRWEKEPDFDAALHLALALFST